MLPIVVLVVFVVVVVPLILGAIRPARFRIERAARIGATPQVVYPLVADFKRWQAWSPWEALDPDLRRTYSGAAIGRGAVYEWDGNNKAGAGRMEITDAPSPGRIVIKLDFTRPFVAHNTTEFTFAGTDGATDVTWTMSGAHNYMMRVMSLFFSMDKMIGKDFEKGLANLRALAERSEQPVAR